MKKIYLYIFLFLFTGLEVMAQSTVSGNVTDKNGKALPGVTVSFVNISGVGTVTDINGKYIIELPAEAKKIVFSFVGMKTQTIDLNNRTSINVKLLPADVDLEEVMVVAFGTAKKESFTGSAGVISNKKLEIRTISSVTQALEGSTTGVQVTSSSGQPGSAPAVRIRGFGTLNGTATPLYIVDGAQYEGSISNISPEDIESMTILKDASSTALYGARAANGVILITTKRGKRGKDPEVSFKTSTGFVDQAIPYYETADPKQYYELMFEAYKNSLIYSNGMDPTDAANQVAADLFNQLKYNPFNVANDQIIDATGKVNSSANVNAKSLDWYEPLTQKGLRQNYNLSISGGGEKHDVLISIGYLDEKGYVTRSHFKRINGRMNFNISPKKWLKIGNNIAATMTKSAFASGTSGNTSYANPFFFARNMGSIYPIYIIDPTTGDYILDAAGKKQYDLGGGYSEYGINPRPAGANPGRHIIAELDYNNNDVNKNILSDRTFTEFSFLDGFKFSINYSIDINNYKWAEFENQIVGDGAPAGRYNQHRYIRTTQNFNQLLTYQKSISNRHNLEILLGHESFDREYTEVYGMKSELIVEGINEFGNFVTPTDLSGYSSRKANEGYFGRLNYNFDNKYYLSTSYRYDGSSVFSSEVRWGGFYSVGASWLASNENFIKSLSFINYLKLRSSYGEVGNDLVGSYYAYQALYETFPNATFPGIRWSTVGNSQLTWEINKNFDVALEFGLFEDRVRGSVEFYNRISSNLLYNMPLPLSMGLATQARNIATLNNSGIEISLGGTILKFKDFSWDLNVMASTLKNKIIDIPAPFVNGSKRWANGHSIYDYYLYDYQGIYPENGAAKYRVWEIDSTSTTGETIPSVGADGKPVYSENYQDSEKGYVGESAIPDLFGSVSNAFKYKNLKLDVLLSYSIGGKILDYNYASLMNEGEFGQALHVDQMNSWRAPNDGTTLPRMEIGNTNLAPTSSRWLTDASFLAFKNVNLTYNFSPSLIKRMGFKNLGLFASGENLFIFTARKGMDPQQSFAGTTSNVYLPSRIISFGLTATF